MKKSIFLLPLIGVLLYLGLSSYSSSPASSGLDGMGARGSTSGCGGTGCHGSAASSALTMSIVLDSSGVSVTSYTPGRTYNIILTATNTFGSTSPALPLFGFQLTAEQLSGSGTTSAVNGGTLASSGLPTGTANHTLGGSLRVVEHTARQNPVSGSGSSGTIYQETISWTAPAAGTGSVKLFGVINAINNNAGADAVDKWNNVTAVITERISSVAPITGPTSVCVGSTIRLADATAGGTWSSSSPGIATISTTGTVSGMSAGTAIITYAIGSLLDTAIVNVLPLPNAGTIIGATRLCTGTTISLTTSGSGGTWTSSAPGVASVSAGTVYGVSPGTAIISYTVTNSCGTATAIYLDTVFATGSAGTISGPTSICLATSITLSSTVSGGTWSTSSTSIASVNATTGSVYGIAVGTARITYTVSTPCGGTLSTFYNDTVTTSVSGGSITGPTTVCPGNNITMTRSSGSGGGVWSSSNPSVATISTSGVVTGITPGTATISYSISGTCGIAAATAPVTVITPPPGIAGPTAVCVGNVVTLTNSSSGGLWSSSNSSVAAAAAGFGTVTGIAPGTVTITYTATTGCTTSMAFRVNRNPGPITGTLQACTGATATVTDTSAGGVWSSQDTTIAKVSGSGIVTARSVSTTTITYTFPSTGCYSTATFTVNPLPSFISGPGAFCANETDTLSNFTIGGTWSATSTSVATINPTSGVLHGVSGGTSTVTYTLPTGCKVTRAIIVHPVPNPSVTHNIFINTMSVPTFYTAYQWYFNGTALSGATTNTVGVALNGAYSIYVEDTFGCKGMSTIYNVNNVGVTDVNSSKFINVYPNPATGLIMIEGPAELRIVITAADGKTVGQYSNVTSVDLSGLASGTYFMMIYNTDGEKLDTKQITKQ